MAVVSATKAAIATLFISLSLLTTGSDGCYDSYLVCIQEYSISINALSLEELPDVPAMCFAMSRAKNCIGKDGADCPENATVPIDLTNFNETLENASRVCSLGLILNARCMDKVAECTKYSLELGAMASGVSDFGNLMVLGMLTNKMCPVIHQATRCSSEFKVMCPDTEYKPRPIDSIDRIAQGFKQLCKDKREPISCPKKAKECDLLTKEAEKKLPTNGQDFIDPSFFCTVLPHLSPGGISVYQEMTKAMDCHKTVVQRCSKYSTSAAKSVQRYDYTVQQVCGAVNDESCTTTVENCVQPFTTKCQHASVENVNTVHECCSLAKTTLDCLRNSGCPDSFFPLGSKAVFESQFDNLCVGYKEYCPGVDECFANTKMTGVEKFCPHMNKILTCISKVCPEQSVRGDLAVIHLRPVFKQICQGLEEYPDIDQCMSYETCTETSIPPLPASQETLQSYSSATDPKYWCRVVRGVSTCSTVTEKSRTCNVTSNFTNHVTSLKSNTDSICNEVREPCPTAAKCMKILFHGDHSTALIATCPNLPDFKSCVNTALDTCGAASRVQAEYSLTQIVDLFSEACHLLTSNPELLSCKNVEPCFRTILPKHPAERLDKFTDQVYWCTTLRAMMKCVASLSTSCNQPDNITLTLIKHYNSVLHFCPYPVIGTPLGEVGKYTIENGGLTVVGVQSTVIIGFIAVLLNEITNFLTL